MASKKMFGNSVAAKVKSADTVNKAGGKAYSVTDEHALSQYVVTSCFNKTFYASDTEQVDKVLQLSQSCNTEFVAKCAVYGHEIAKMKDTPAMLLAVLAARSKNNAEAAVLFKKIFPRVITNGKMLMNFVQIVRSGVTGRRSFGTLVKRTIHAWLESKSGNQIFTGSIGASPSFADIVKMVHPKPESDEKKALYAYFIGREYDAETLPPKVKDFEAFKQGKKAGVKMPVPDVPFQMLTALELTPEEWGQIAHNLPWNALRMNLNTLARHNVFNAKGMVEYVAQKIANADEVRKNSVFPYQLLAAYLNTENIPQQVKNALQDALEVATENVQSFGVPTAVCIDTSGSMGSAITGIRKGSTSKVRCVDVASLIGATIARRNSDTTLLPFDTHVHSVASLNARDSIMTNADKLRRFGGGGTDCASALRVLNGLVGNRPKVIIYVSDLESWFNGKGTYNYGYRYGGTGMAAEWESYKKKTPDAKLVLIDLQANDTTQVTDSPDVLNVAGFNDRVFDIVNRFVNNDSGHFVDVINTVSV